MYFHKSGVRILCIFIKVGRVPVSTFSQLRFFVPLCLQVRMSHPVSFPFFVVPSISYLVLASSIRLHYHIPPSSFFICALHSIQGGVHSSLNHLFVVLRQRGALSWIVIHFQIGHRFFWYNSLNLLSKYLQLLDLSLCSSTYT